MNAFISDLSIGATSWAAFERLVARLLVAEGYHYVSVVGTSGDGGADVLGIRDGRRWLFQVKRLSSPVGPNVLNRTIAAAKSYEADIPVVVSRSGFTVEAQNHRSRFAAESINIQLWNREHLAKRAQRLPEDPPIARRADFAIRKYQEDAVQKIVGRWVSDSSSNALAILATGLGKTTVAAEALRRIAKLKKNLRVVVLAHTNDLVFQLERAWWPYLRSDQLTCVVNGAERPDLSKLGEFDYVFATRDSWLALLDAGHNLPSFDVVVVDECHHLGAASYEHVLEMLGVGATGGPFLLGLTATPWRPDGSDLGHRFDEPVVNIDLVQGLQNGFLANVDYRMFTDNVDWDALKQLHGDRFTPKAINRTLFINQWDDAVVNRFSEAWSELQGKGRGIVFCGTVDHAERMASRINSLGLTKALPIYSQSTAGVPMSPIQRNKLLWDFAAGRIGVLCAVDVLNEGVDVPDVNLVVFQRVTHSRRIFVQQLGRGLRLAPEKTKVVVLDFVSDVRRFAAGLELKKCLDDGPKQGNPARVNLPSSVVFMRANKEDTQGAAFLREWLQDLNEIEEAGEDVNVLRYPPTGVMPAQKAIPT